MRTRKTSLELEVYSSQINIYYADSIVSCVETIRKKYPLIEPSQEDEEGAGISFSDYPNYPGVYWIIITPGCSLREITHEAFHTTARLLHEHAVMFDVENDEPYSYLVSYLTETVYNFINKKK
jgi:hypothetical protein